MTAHSSARADELIKFNQLSDQWWDEHGAFAALHAINPLRIEFIKQHTQIRDACVLDVGCGGGILSEGLFHEGATVTGLDLAADALKAAKTHAEEYGLPIDYRLEDIIAYAQTQTDRFDIVTCMEMLEHVDQPQAIVHALAKAVKPGGWVFLSTLNRNPKSWLFGIVAAEYLLKLVPRGTHDHSHFIKPSELAAMARQAGLSPVALTGITYNPLTKSYALNAHDLDVNYLMACRRHEL